MLKTKQKLIVQTFKSEFHRIVNDMLEQGWMVVPGTMLCTMEDGKEVYMLVLSTVEES